MDSAPELISNVTFSERKRGYDPEEVDTYLHELADTVARLKDVAREALDRAEAAEARVADHKREAAALEQQIADLRSKAEAGGDAGQDPTTQAAGILAMAQKTADEAVADAERRARQLEADARTRADEVVAEAEQRAATLRDETQREVDGLRSSQLGALRDEIAELERSRDAVRTDVDQLDRFLRDGRATLHDVLADLLAVVDDPARLQLGDRPGAAAADEAAAEVEIEVEEQAGPAPVALDDAGAAAVDEEAPSGSDAAPSEVSVAAAEAVPASTSEDEGTAEEVPAAIEAASVPEGGTAEDVPAVDEVPPTPEGASAEGEPVAEVAAAEAPAPHDEPAPEAPAEPVSGEPAAERADEPTQAVPAAALFADEDEVDAGSLFERAPGDPSPFGEPDEAADAAMRAFFESDLDDDEKGRWGFGRKR